MNFQDRTLTCSDCNCDFTFTVAEQELYHQRGYLYEPKRCPACRQVRKARQLANADTGNAGGQGSFNAPHRRMFPAVCSDCGKATTVPFEPKLDRPVYCLDCYRKSRAAK